VEAPPYDLVLRGGRVIDPAREIDGHLDVAVRGGTIAAVAPAIAAARGTRVIDVPGRLVVPGMIDTHAHVYQYVTGAFGMNPDLVGVRSGVTTVIDQGGASPLTIDGFRKFIAEPASTRVLAFISNYLVGGLVGHRYVKLYGPDGINVGETVRAIERNRDLVKGIKCHAEVGGYSRWGIETLRLAKQAAREARVPVYIHLGRLWAEADGTRLDPDTVMAEVATPASLRPGPCSRRGSGRSPSGPTSTATPSSGRSTRPGPPGTSTRVAGRAPPPAGCWGGRWCSASPRS
jgi:dihydroorotase